MIILLTILLVLFWLALGKIAVMKIKAEQGLWFLYLTAPFIHFFVLFAFGVSNYMKDNWDEIE
jgi:hypothetical protein